MPETPRAAVRGKRDAMPTACAQNYGVHTTLPSPQPPPIPVRSSFSPRRTWRAAVPISFIEVVCPDVKLPIMLLIELARTKLPHSPPHP